MKAKADTKPTPGLVLFLLCLPTVSMAYFDPGNGAFMVQAVFTLVGAALFYLKHPIRSIRAFGSWLVSKCSGKLALQDDIAVSDQENS